MKHIRKVLSIAAVLAIMHVIYFGSTNQAHADFIFDPAIFTLVNQISTNDLNKIDNSYYTPVIFKSSSSSLFSFGSNVMLGATSPPRPIPHGDDPENLTSPEIGLETLLTQQGFNNAGDLVMLGYVSPPRPGPHGHDFNSLGWASNAVFVNGELDLLNLSIDVDKYAFIQPGEALYIFGATKFTDLDSVQLTGSLAGSFMLINVDTQDPGLALARSVPEPSTMLLLGTGLFGLAGIGIGRRKKTASK